MSRKSQRSRVEMFRKDFILLPVSVAAVMRQKPTGFVLQIFSELFTGKRNKAAGHPQYHTRHFQGYLLSRKAQGISHRLFRMKGR